MPNKKWTISAIRALSEQERRLLYERASVRPDGSYIVEMMNDSGVAPKSKLMSFTDPVFRQMSKIAKSTEGKAAMEEAASKGQPALCGFDRLLQRKIGKDYNDERCPGTMMSAGSLVAEMMPKLGYIKAGKATCPDDCVAREGIIWTKD